MEKKAKVLIVEDDHALKETLKKMLERRHFKVNEADTVKSAALELKKVKFDVVLLDLTLPDGSGINILRKVPEDYKNRFIIISGTGTITTAVEAMKAGAFDYLEKPIDRDVILATMEKVINLNRQLDEYRVLKDELKCDPTFKKIIYKSQVIKELQEKAIRIAQTDDSILVTGETGTGKELFAHAIYNASKRSNGPFIPVNCATISKDLAESELFGFERGAFTGAHESYPGKFGLAEKGTIFLDEITELSETIQAKLLRIFESGEIFPLRSKRVKKVDVRVIAATNQDLDLLVKEGSFRQDLFFRIDQNRIHIPPLRERREDIMPLVEHYLNISAVSNSYTPKTVSKESKELLQNYYWPGNVRELKNTLNSIAPYISSKQIIPSHLPLKIQNYKGQLDETNHHLSLKEVEREHILKVLRSTNFNMQKTAKILNVSRSTLYLKLSEYNIKR
jgi:two-component system response regulator AtoC